MGTEHEISQYFVGPLNINRHKKQANTVLGVSLTLGESGFYALDMLAARENVPFTFDQLYSTVWVAGNCQASRTAARMELDNLIEQVGAAGQGFMWIEHSPGSDYTFRTRWKRGW